MEELHLTREQIREGAGFAAVSYIFILWVLPFIFKKQNEFARYHAKQGLVIFIGEVVCGFLCFIPVLGILFYSIGMILFFFLSLYGIYSALTGKLCKIPVVTEIAAKFVI